MSRDPSCITLSQQRLAPDQDTSGKRNKDAYYYISLTIPQSGHFLSSVWMSARQLDDASGS